MYEIPSANYNNLNNVIIITAVEKAPPFLDPRGSFCWSCMLTTDNKQNISLSGFLPVNADTSVAIVDPG